MTFSEIIKFDGKTVAINFLDGEIASAKVLFVDLEYEDIVIDIIETNRPARYRPEAVYLVAPADLLSVSELPSPV